MDSRHHPWAVLRLTPPSGAGTSLTSVGGSLAIAYLVWLLVGRPGASASPWADELFWLSLTMITAAGCWQVVRSPALPASLAGAWRLGIASMLVLGGSLLLDALFRALGFTAAANIAGITGLLHLPLVAAALLKIPVETEHHREHAAWVLDRVILAVSGALLLWLLVVRSVTPPDGGDLLVRVAAYGFPIAQFATLSLVAALWIRRPVAIAVRPLVFLTIALGATLAGDLVFSVRLEDAAAATPLAAELAWLVGAAAGLLTPIAQLRALEDAPARRNTVVHGVPSIAPYVVAASVAAGLLLTESEWQATSEFVAVAGTVVVLGLVVWRQWYAHREHAAALASRAQLDARYTALVEGGSDLVAIADQQGTLQFISPSAERILGYAPSQVIGLTIRSFLHPDEQDSWSVILADLVTRGELESTPPSTWRIRAADGRWIHLQATAVNRMSDPAVRGVILNGRDVTAQTDLEERLRQARQMEAIGRFSSVIAHDFNHVLSAIKLNVQLQRDVPTDGASSEEILSAVELGAALTRQLMAVSQHRSVAPVVLEVGEVLRDTERAVQSLVGADVTLRCETPSEPIHVRADAAQLRQVLMNLIINARDAAPTGNIRLALATRQMGMEDTRSLIGLKPGPHAVLTVEDDGAGMSPAVLQRLFEPFFTTKPGGRGTGLGLTIVYGIVTAFGGVIDASSIEGSGSRFEILLPIADPQHAEAIVGTKTPTTGRRCVLIVDDDAAIRSALQRAFTLRGCTALVAEDGVDALARLREHGTAIHVVLTDMRMPRLDGPGLIAAMDREWPTLPVVGMSGFLHADDHARLAPRVRRIIEKPFTLDEVVRAVDDALA